MGYASIEGENSHRQNKKFKQRLKYRIDQGYTHDEAFRLASAKEFIKNPALRLLPNPSAAENRPAQSKAEAEIRSPMTDINTCDFRRDENRQSIGRNSSDEQNPFVASTSCIPTEDETRLMVERLKYLGLMTEIPSQPKIVSSAEVGSASHPQVPSAEKESSSEAPQQWPFWTVAGLASAWLVYSMTSSMPGNWFWNLLIAIAFEVSPMLILGAKIDPKSHTKAAWGAFAIFLIGLVLYLAPSAQTLFNESSAYLDAKDRYAAQSEEFQTKQGNSAALVLTAKVVSELSAEAYVSASKAYGDNSWRTVSARKQKDADFREWKEQSAKVEAMKAPEMPQISDELTKSARAIAARLGLFIVVFVMMFVGRRV